MPIAIDKPSKYFNTLTWTGNGSSRNITGTGFDPNFVWIKNRSNGTRYHVLNDSVRGANKQLFSNVTNAEETDTAQLTAFITDGFSLGTNANVNSNGDNFVSWNWLANSSSSSNTSGTITSTVSANTTSGFSIVSYTGSNSNTTVGHGLGVAPSMYIVKNRTSSNTYAFATYHKSLGNGNFVYLAGTDASISAGYWNNTSPTSTVFSVQANNLQINQSGSDYIAYCFAEVKGFSKFGSYIGNGSTDGTFVYTGFKPAMIIAKNSSSAVSWTINDNKRNTFNPNEKFLYPNLSDAEGTNLNIDYLSNGFKIRATSTLANTSGETYIYACFADNPFVSSKGIPTTAR